MTTEKTDQKEERDESWAFMDCCSPQMFADLRDKYGAGKKCDCGAMMQMMKDGCRQPEQK